MPPITRVLLCFILLTLSACTTSTAEQVAPSQKEEATVSQANQLSTVKKEQLMEIREQSWQQVTVKYLDLEGGFYGLVSKEGGKLLPMNLPKKYKIDGTVLRVKGQPIKNMMTIQQWGTPFKVIDIKLIKMGTGNLPSH